MSVCPCPVPSVVVLVLLQLGQGLGFLGVIVFITLPPLLIVIFVCMVVLIFILFGFWSNRRFQGLRLYFMHHIELIYILQATNVFILG